MARQPISDKQGDHNKSDETPKKKRASRANKHRRFWKRNKVIVFISVISLFVAAVLFSIAIAVWQKGHLWPAFYWGILSYAVLGFAIFFSYHAYVIDPSKAAKTSKRPQRASKTKRTESVYITITDSKLERAISSGDYPTLYFTLNNGPLSVRGTIRNVSVYYCGIEEQVFPWGEGMTKNFALMPNERTTVIFRFNNFIFTNEQISILTQEKARLLFYFRGEFTDDYGRTYPMKHCFIWNKYMGVNLALCEDDIRLE